MATPGEKREAKARRCWGFSFTYWRRCRQKITGRRFCPAHKHQRYGLIAGLFLTFGPAVIAYRSLWIASDHDTVRNELQGSREEILNELRSQEEAVKEEIRAQIGPVVSQLDTMRSSIDSLLESIRRRRASGDLRKIDDERLDKLTSELREVESAVRRQSEVLRKSDLDPALVNRILVEIGRLKGLQDALGERLDQIIEELEQPSSEVAEGEDPLSGPPGDILSTEPLDRGSDSGRESVSPSLERPPVGAPEADLSISRGPSRPPSPPTNLRLASVERSDPNPPDDPSIRAALAKPAAGETVETPFFTIEGSVRDYEEGRKRGFHYWVSFVERQVGTRNDSLDYLHYPQFSIRSRTFSEQAFVDPRTRDEKVVHIIIVEVDSATNEAFLRWRRRGIETGDFPALLLPESQVLASNLALLR